VFLEGSMKRKRLKNRLKRQIIRQGGKKMAKPSPQKSSLNPFNDLGFWFWVSGLDFSRFFEIWANHDAEQASGKENI
jgi:hypothetical protein